MIVEADKALVLLQVVNVSLNVSGSNNGSWMEDKTIYLFVKRFTSSRRQKMPASANW